MAHGIGGTEVSANRVLIVDDEPDVLKALGNYLERRGYEVHRASSGEVGLELHHRVRPDVTVLDVVMPGMSGLEVLGRLRERQAMVIMLTGHAEVEVAVQAMRLGAENFLLKPVDMEHLTAAIDKAVEKGMLKRENVALKRRLRSSVRRRLVQMAFLVLLVLASAVIGRAIGRGFERERVRSPIPVPIDSVVPDTVTPSELQR
jgi:DNA-binding NtrC family response regulator